MELINELVVVGFPWLKDWKYKFSQDTIIEWKYWSGKTSILKSITWMLTWKDLQWRNIPNITDKTKVSSIWLLKLSRVAKWLSWDISLILRWDTDNILSRIIPWYLFAWWMTNKRIIEIITWINMDAYNKNWFTLLKHNEQIKSLQKYWTTLNHISENVFSFVDNKFNNWIAQHIIYDVPTLLKFNIAINKFKDIYQNVCKEVEFANNTKWVTLLDKELKTLKSFSLLKEFTEHKDPMYSLIVSINALQKWWILVSDFMHLVEKLNNNLKRINYTLSNIKEYIKDHFNEVTMETLEYYYYKILNNTLKLSDARDKKQQFISELHDNINSNLNQYWIKLSWNNTLTINVNYKDKQLTLDELPRHIKFLMEINLCSRLQLNWIHWTHNWQDLSWLILIDDYALPDDDESIDSLLAEWLSHQVIITKTNPKISEIKITI